jgi:hypothetical protein
MRKSADAVHLTTAPREAENVADDLFAHFVA